LQNLLAVEITDTANQVKAKAEPFSAIAVTVGNYLEPFDEPDNLFIQNSLRSYGSVEELIFFCQRTFL